MGISFYLLLSSMVEISILELPTIIGIIAFSGVTGLIAFFAPAGIGVREGLLIFFLSKYYPLEIATVLALLQRIWALATDVLLSIFIIIYKVVRINKNNKMISKSH